MPSTPLGVILNEARRHGLIKDLQQVTYRMTTNGKTERLHIATGGTLCGSRTTRGSERYTLQDLKSPKNRCMACMEMLSTRGRALHQGSTWELIQAVGYITRTRAETLENIKVAQDLDGRDLAARLNGVLKLSRTEHELEDVIMAVENKSPIEDVQAFQTYQVREARKIQDTIKDALRTSEVRRDLAGYAKEYQVLSGGKHQEEGKAQRVTVWVTNLRTALYASGSDLFLRAALIAWEATSTHEGQALVVLTPKGLGGRLENLMRLANYRAHRGTGTIQGSDLPSADPVLLETALGLWELGGTGPLKSLQNAVDAAARIHQ